MWPAECTKEALFHQSWPCFKSSQAQDKLKHPQLWLLSLMDYWARWCNLILKAHYENWRQGIQTDHIAHSVFVSSCTTRFIFYLTSPHTCTHTHWEDAICYIHLLHTMKPIPSFSFECGYFCSVYILHVCGTALRKYHQCSSCTVQLLQVSFCIFRAKIQQHSSDYFQQNIVSVAEPSSTVHEN